MRYELKNTLELNNGDRVEIFGAIFELKNKKIFKDEPYGDVARFETNLIEADEGTRDLMGRRSIEEWIVQGNERAKWGVLK